MMMYPTSSIGSPLLLDEDFVPGPKHIIISRRKKLCLNHEGNKNLRGIVHSRLDQYAAAEKNKDRKSEIIIEILEEVHSGDLSQGFVKYDPTTGRYLAVEDAPARIFIAQMFRDILCSNYRSSKTNKQRRRVARKQINMKKSSEAKETSSMTLAHLTFGEGNNDSLLGLSKRTLRRTQTPEHVDKSIFDFPSLGEDTQEDCQGKSIFDFPSLGEDEDTQVECQGDSNLLSTLLRAFGDIHHEDPYEPTPLIESLCYNMEPMVPHF